MHFPQYTADRADLKDTNALLGSVIVENRPALIPDICTINILNHQMIVSHKCTHNLFDLTNLWKKIVLLNLEQHILPANEDPVSQDNVSDMEISSNYQDNFSSSDSNMDPFVQLLWNRGAIF